MKCTRQSIFVVVAFAALFANVFAQGLELKKVRVNNVELTYIEQGSGEPIIFLHGGQADYRSWLPYADRFSKKYQFIAYSRRYNYPNDNPIRIRNHSALVEADDLAAFIDKLKLQRVHLVGTSIGAFAALVYAVKHPKRVISLTLAEPAVNAWARNTLEYKNFTTNAWIPAGAAFRRGDDQEAMRLLVDIFGGEGSFAKMPEQAKAVAIANARFFRAATLSNNPIPDLSKARVGKLQMPILIIQGEKTFELSKIIVKELRSILPAAETIIIPNAGHGSPREDPKAFGDALDGFLSSQKN